VILTRKYLRKGPGTCIGRCLYIPINQAQWEQLCSRLDQSERDRAALYPSLWHDILRILRYLSRGNKGRQDLSLHCSIQFGVNQKVVCNRSSTDTCRSLPQPPLLAKKTTTSVRAMYMWTGAVHIVHHPIGSSCSSAQLRADLDATLLG
jgi:hypothetical protein